MKQNEIVKYSKPDGELESSFRFVLLHVEAGKADIRLISNDRIQPIETVAVEEIQPA